MLNFEGAVSALTAVLVYAPSCAQAYYLRGKAFLCLNEYKVALGDFMKAKDYSPVGGEMASHISEMISEIQYTLKGVDQDTVSEQSMACPKQALNRFLKKDKRGGYISSNNHKKQREDPEEAPSRWPGLYKFVRICLWLLRRSVLCWNGTFNMVILALLYYFIVQKKCLFKLFYILYKRVERYERMAHLRK
jgi:tetratricopeptide (TPR) repeat protein